MSIEFQVAGAGTLNDWLKCSGRLWLAFGIDVYQMLTALWEIGTSSYSY